MKFFISIESARDFWEFTHITLIQHTKKENFKGGRDVGILIAFYSSQKSLSFLIPLPDFLIHYSLFFSLVMHV
jgi:hypothetical protein